MKRILLIPDGAADRPCAALGSRTPLEAAATPHLDRLAARGRLGTARTIPDGLPAGSDVGNMALLGFDPRLHHPGRGPIEAAAMGLALADGEVAFRANLVTIRDGAMADYAGGHVSTAEARGLVERVAGACADLGVRFHAGVAYRHIMIARAGADAVTSPPHDNVGRPIDEILPTGPDAGLLRAVIDRSREALAGRAEANAVWPWGQGRARALPPVPLRGVIITAVDVIRGLGRLAGLEVLDVPGATGYFDTDYAAKGRAAVEALLAGAEIAVIHVEAPDEAGHEGNATEKVRALEAIDARIVGPVIEALDRSGASWRLLVAPDHPTPIDVRTHTRDDVPWLLATSADAAPGTPGRRFTEAAAAAAGKRHDAWDLLRSYLL